MRYYTWYTLSVKKIENIDRFKLLEKELEDRDLIKYAFLGGVYHENEHEAVFYSYDSVKWYDHPTDMVHVAEKFPEMYFMLEGNGEEFGDFWREYYHDMDVEYCRGDIVFEQPKKIQWNELMKF